LSVVMGEDDREIGVCTRVVGGVEEGEGGIVVERG